MVVSTCNILIQVNTEKKITKCFTRFIVPSIETPPKGGCSHVEREMVVELQIQTWQSLTSSGEGKRTSHNQLAKLNRM